MSSSASSTTDYYAVLGIPRTSTHDDIRRTYRRLSMKMHPDRNMGEEGQYKEINNAYDTLGDPTKREQYDVQLRMSEMFSSTTFASGAYACPYPNASRRHGKGVGVGVGGATNMVDLTHLLGGLFAAHHGGHSAETSSTPLSSVISLLSEIFGDTDHHAFGTNEDADVLFGKTSSRPTSSRPTSSATPTSTSSAPPFRTKPEDMEVNVRLTLEQVYAGCTMPTTVTRSIVTANAYGVEERTTSTETMYVDIPEGTDHDETILVCGAGHRFHGARGDVRVRVAIESSPGPLKRNGLDMVYSKSLSLREALCGVSFNVELFGTSYKICNNEGSVIPPSHTKVLKGLGMKRGGHVGNLVIQFSVRFPKTLSSDKCAWLRQNMSDEADSIST